VSAVIEDLPDNCHIRANFIINHQARRRFVENPENFDRPTAQVYLWKWL